MKREKGKVRKVESKQQGGIKGPQRNIRDQIVQTDPRTKMQQHSAMENCCFSMC